MAQNPLARKDGRHTSALYGYCTGILGLLERLRPTHVMAAMEGGKKTFRHEMFPDYKGHRPSLPPPLVWQLEQMRPLNVALDVNPFHVEGYEADDVIGTATQVAAGKGFKVSILSHDKDFMQLLGPGVEMVKLTKGSDYSATRADDVVGLIGVRADQVVDYLALMGDSADNVPGVKGIGPKRAAALLNKYGTLDEVVRIATSGVIEGSMDASDVTSMRLVRESLDNVRLSQKLTAICRTVPGLPDIESLEFRGFDAREQSKLSRHLESMGMVRTLGRFRASPLSTSFVSTVITG